MSQHVSGDIIKIIVLLSWLFRNIFVKLGLVLNALDTFGSIIVKDQSSYLV